MDIEKKIYCNLSHNARPVLSGTHYSILFEYHIIKKEKALFLFHLDQLEVVHNSFMKITIEAGAPKWFLESILLVKSECFVFDKDIP